MFIGNKTNDIRAEQIGVQENREHNGFVAGINTSQDEVRIPIFDNTHSYQQKRQETDNPFQSENRNMQEEEQKSKIRYSFSSDSKRQPRGHPQIDSWIQRNSRNSQSLGRENSSVHQPQSYIHRHEMFKLYRSKALDAQRAHKHCQPQEERNALQFKKDTRPVERK